MDGQVVLVLACCPGSSRHCPTPTLARSCRGTRFTLHDRAVQPRAAAAAYVVLPTASHMATTHGVDLGSPGFPCSLLSWLSSLCSSKPYLMDVDENKKGCCCSSSLSSWFTFTNCCCSSSKPSDGKTEEKKQQVNSGSCLTIISGKHTSLRIACRGTVRTCWCQSLT